MWQQLLAIAVTAWAALNAAYRAKKDIFARLGVELRYGLVLVIKRRSGAGSSGAWASLGPVYLSLLAASAAAFYWLAFSELPKKLTGAGTGMRLVVPGIDIVGVDLIHFIASLSIAALLHEVFHGKTSQAVGVPVKHFGVVLAFLVPAAFTEIDEKVFASAEKRHKLYIVSAGVAANALLALLGLGLLAAMVSSSGLLVTSVLPGSVAEASGITSYSIIVSVNGKPLRSVGELREILNDPAQQILNITFVDPGGRVRSAVVAKNSSTLKLGVYLSSPPADWMAKLLGVGPSSQVVRFTWWLYVVNANLAIINAAPIFISDGGKALFLIAGKRGQKAAVAANALTLVALLLLIVPFPA